MAEGIKRHCAEDDMRGDTCKVCGKIRVRTPSEEEFIHYWAAHTDWRAEAAEQEARRGLARIKDAARVAGIREASTFLDMQKGDEDMVQAMKVAARCLWFYADLIEEETRNG
jgi:hypothetical protein